MNIFHTVNLFFVVVTLTASTSVNAISLFGPDDYEECAAEAAEDANSEAALNILLSECRSEFPARRKRDGSGYYYYEPLYRLRIDVSDPRLSSADRQKIERVKSEAREREKIEQQQREIARKKYKERVVSAKRNFLITDWQWQCTGGLSSISECYSVGIQGTLENGTRETISEFELQFWVIQDGSCGVSSNARTIKFRKTVRPNQKIDVSGEVEYLWNGFNMQVYKTGCIRVSDLKIR